MVAYLPLYLIQAGLCIMIGTCLPWRARLPAAAPRVRAAARRRARLAVTAARRCPRRPQAGDRDETLLEEVERAVERGFERAMKAWARAQEEGRHGGSSESGEQACGHAGRRGTHATAGLQTTQ